TVFPAATPAAGTLTAIDVAEVSFAFVPMFLTNAMPARASDAARLNTSASASVATARRAGSGVFAPEVSGRQLVRLIMSPLRIANAASSFFGQTIPAPSGRRRGETAPLSPRGPRGAVQTGDHCDPGFFGGTGWQ